MKPPCAPERARALEHTRTPCRVCTLYACAYVSVCVCLRVGNSARHHTAPCDWSMSRSSLQAVDPVHVFLCRACARASYCTC